MEEEIDRLLAECEEHTRVLRRDRHSVERHLFTEIPSIINNNFATPDRDAEELARPLQIAIQIAQRSAAAELDRLLEQKKDEERAYRAKLETWVSLVEEADREVRGASEDGVKDEGGALPGEVAKASGMEILRRWVQEIEFFLVSEQLRLQEILNSWLFRAWIVAQDILVVIIAVLITATLLVLGLVVLWYTARFWINWLRWVPWILRWILSWVW